jgi:hypothetical protein
MVKTVKDGEGDERAGAIRRPNGSDWNALVQPLVRPCLVEVTAILRKNREQVAFAENEKESGAGESHPRALAEPYVSLSTHTAPIIPFCPETRSQFTRRIVRKS